MISGKTEISVVGREGLRPRLRRTAEESTCVPGRRSDSKVIPGFTLLFVYFAFDSLCHKIPKSFDCLFPLLGFVFRIVKN
jgi:hypothetical protein